MKVLAVTHEATRTGAVRAFLEALPVLRELGTELIVLNKSPGPLSPEFTALSDQVIESPRRGTSRMRSVARVRSLDRFVPAIERMIARSVLREVRPDLVYASTVLSSEYAAAAQHLRIPAALHVHEAQPLSGWALRRSGVDVRSVPMAAPSHFVARELEELSGRTVRVLLGPSRATDRPVATPPPDLPWTGDGFRVVSCGSVAPWKGPDEWLEAADRLSAVRDRCVEWMWVGSGEQLSRLQKETCERGLDDRVHWIGERRDVEPYLASADLFVLTSHNEPLGLVLLEAARAGVASVAFRTGGVEEILVEERALAESGNVGELVEKARMALTNPALRAELLDASRPSLLASEPTEWRAHLAEFLSDAVHGGELATVAGS